jgi:serine/threonine-protein kinase
LQGGFGRLWNSSAAIQERIGCPIRGEAPGPAAEQVFEGGTMYWWGPTQQIYVLSGGSTGRWSPFPNTWQEGDQQLPLDPPAGYHAPIRGFGTVWRNNAAVQEYLGWGLGPERGLTGVYQSFDGGAMLYSTALNDDEPRIYVLFDDGTYTTYSDVP